MGLIYDAPESATSGGPDSLNRISASISGTSAGIRLPRGPKASDEADGNTGRQQPVFEVQLSQTLRPILKRFAGRLGAS